MKRRAGASAARLNVLSWEWNAATLVSLRPDTNREQTIHQGRLLAAALAGAGLDPARTQIIGHSSGSIVAASAAADLLARFRRPVAQLTLLEPAKSYHSTLFGRLAAGRSAAVVENYWVPGPSGYGHAARYPGVQNHLVPSQAPIFGVICPLRSDHLYVVHWYLATVANPIVGQGFNNSAILAPPR